MTYSTISININTDDYTYQLMTLLAELTSDSFQEVADFFFRAGYFNALDEYRTSHLDAEALAKLDAFISDWYFSHKDQE